MVHRTHIRYRERACGTKKEHTVQKTSIWYTERECGTENEQYGAHNKYTVQTSTWYRERVYGTQNEHMVHINNIWYTGHLFLRTRFLLHEDGMRIFHYQVIEICYRSTNDNTAHQKLRQPLATLTEFSRILNVFELRNKYAGILQDQLQARGAGPVPFGSNCSFANISFFRAFQYFFTQMDRNTTPPWVKIPLRSLHIPAPVHQDYRSTHNSYYRGRQPFFIRDAVTLTYVPGLQNRPRRAAGVTQ